MLITERKLSISVKSKVCFNVELSVFDFENVFYYLISICFGWSEVWVSLFATQRPSQRLTQCHQLRRDVISRAGIRIQEYKVVTTTTATAAKQQ